MLRAFFASLCMTIRRELRWWYSLRFSKRLINDSTPRTRRCLTGFPHCPFRTSENRSVSFRRWSEGGGPCSSSLQHYVRRFTDRHKLGKGRTTSFAGCGLDPNPKQHFWEQPPLFSADGRPQRLLQVHRFQRRRNDQLYGSTGRQRWVLKSLQRAFLRKNSRNGVPRLKLE